jgi:uncharacterized protein YndB with AHSA1/START domain
VNSNDTAPDRHGSAVVTRPSDTELRVVRAFDAPAALLFEAWTTPEFVKRWWGYETSEWIQCDIDLRVGGMWRFVIKDDGFEVAFRGVYKEISPPHRLVNTELYEGVPGATDDDAALVTTTFDEVDGVTTLTQVSEFAQKEHLDAAIESGMESGMQVAFDRLEDAVRAEA